MPWSALRGRGHGQTAVRGPEVQKPSSLEGHQPLHEDHVGHLALLLVTQVRLEKALVGAGEHAPRVLRVEQDLAGSVGALPQPAVAGVTGRVPRVVEQDDAGPGQESRRAGLDQLAVEAAGPWPENRRPLSFPPNYPLPRDEAH